MKKQTTIHDIARYLDITASTVSRALNNHPRISDSTKKRVREAAKMLEYNHNIVAANLRKGTANTIGVIIPLINRHFFANIISGIENIANPAGYNIIICSSNENLDKEIKNVHTLVNNRVSGILISISAETKNANHLEPIFNSDIPVVQFDRTIDTLATSKIINDDFQGAYQNVTHLIEQGYSSIAHFAGPQYIISYRKRFEGYKLALEENNLPFRKELVFEGIIDREKGNSIMEYILQNYPEVDALFAASDMSALGALICMKKHNIQVPVQMGISGYVNEPFGEYIDPSLTTTEQFGTDIGKEAANELISILTTHAKHNIKQRIITPKLIIRDSTLRTP